MDAFWLDFANLLLRWLHLITGIAWIGASFYFVWLDNHLAPVDDPDKKALGIGGELWSVHGGGFYNAQKYPVGPKTMPKHELHWFYWESYWTWMSGFALFIALYLFNPQTYLVDANVYAWSSAGAVIAALLYLASGLLVYEIILRVFGRTKNGAIGGDLKVGIAVAIYVVLASWIACQIFSGRAAFLMTGAMLATIMSANVLIWIIPGQRKVVASLIAKETPDPIHGQVGKQRSVHNTYFTLPVLFAMLSNHYSSTYSHPHNWLVLVLIMVAGALVREFFVQRHKGRTNIPVVMAAVLMLAGIGWWISPAPSVTAMPSEKSASAVPFSDVRKIVAARCELCHNRTLASKGLRLDSDQAIADSAARINQQVVVEKIMPLNNATSMSDDERLLIKQWFASGASITQ